METTKMMWANFEQLRLRYHENTRAHWASDILEDLPSFRKSQDPQSNLIAGELKKEKRAIKRRSPILNAVDDLLAFYSLVEIASMVGCLPDPLPKQFATSALNALSDSELARYCKRQERVLPLLLKYRLQGEPLSDSRETSSDEAVSVFTAFLDINAAIEDDPEVEAFFQYLSGEEWEGYDLNDLVSLTRRPKEFLRHLARDADCEESDGLSIALHGFSSFLSFSERLDSLLRSCSDNPILRSALWHFHSERFYGFSSEIRNYLDKVLENFNSWRTVENVQTFPKDETSKPLNREIRESLEESLESQAETRWVMWRLTSDLYKRPLEEVFNRRTGGWITFPISEPGSAEPDDEGAPSAEPLEPQGA